MGAELFVPYKWAPNKCVETNEFRTIVY